MARPGEPMDGLAGARQNASSRLDSLGMPPDIAAGTPTGTGKQPLAAVNYRAATDQNRCGNCTYWHPDGTCDLVAGQIDSQATCDLYAPAGAGGPGGPATAGPPPAEAMMPGAQR